MSIVKIHFNISEIFQKVAEEVVLRTTQKATTLAKRYARKDTGALRQSITGVVNGLTGEVYSELDYAHEQEYGSKENPRKRYKPYLRPSAKIAGSQAEIDKSTEASIRRLAR